MSSSGSGSGSGSSSGSRPTAAPPARTSNRPLAPPPPPPPRTATPTTTSTTMPPPPPGPYTPPLHLTVRFSTSLPDLQLDIPAPAQTTVAALKQLIRSRLNDEAGSGSSTSNSAAGGGGGGGGGQGRRRLRFIHGGRILPDAATLGASLRPLAPPPPSSSSTSTTQQGGAAGQGTRGKGKGVEGAPPPARVYVNCSIGDVLTDEELAAEAEAATAAAAAVQQGQQQQQARGGDNDDGLTSPTSSSLSSPTSPSAGPGGSRSRLGPGGRRSSAATSAQSQLQLQRGQQQASSSQQQQQQQQARRRTIRGTAGPGLSSASSTRGGGPDPASSTTPPPRGFDRLLAAGFSPAEVNQLRLQFTSIQASRHTPDTMPSPDSLRSMEDSWLDSNSYAGGGSSSAPASSYPLDPNGDGEGGPTAADSAAEEFGINGLLDVLVRGMIIGFVWPLASVGWLVREEGLWSRKWRVFVSFGFVLSLVIGTIKAISGDR